MVHIIILLLSLMSVVNLQGSEFKISADTYFNYSFEEMTKNSYQINRAYFTIENTVSESISYKFRTDVGSGNASDLSLYLKSAKLDWNTRMGKFSFGLQVMNMFKAQENNWGYRFIEKSAMDRQKYSSSADMGIGWTKSLGTFTPSILITNGSGYKHTENDGYKKLSTNLIYRDGKLKQGMSAGIAFSFEPEDYEISHSSANASTETGNVVVTAVFGTWTGRSLKVGAEAAIQTENLETASDKQLISVYYNYMFNRKIAGFGRLDNYFANSATDIFLILGLNYHPEQALYIAPNTRITLRDDGEIMVSYNLSFRFKI